MATTLMEKLNYPSLYGQASPLLKRAVESQQALDDFIESQLIGAQDGQKFS